MEARCAVSLYTRLELTVCPVRCALDSFFLFRRYIHVYCFLVYVVCFSLIIFSSLFPYSSPPLLVFFFENRPAPFLGAGPVELCPKLRTQKISPRRMDRRDVLSTELDEGGRSERLINWTVVAKVESRSDNGRPL